VCLGSCYGSLFFHQVHISHPSKQSLSIGTYQQQSHLGTTLFKNIRLLGTKSFPHWQQWDLCCQAKSLYPLSLILISSVVYPPTVFSDPLANKGNIFWGVLWQVLKLYYDMIYQLSQGRAKYIWVIDLQLTIFRLFSRRLYYWFCLFSLWCPGLIKTIWTVRYKILNVIQSIRKSEVFFHVLRVAKNGKPGVPEESDQKPPHHP